MAINMNQTIYNSIPDNQALTLTPQLHDVYAIGIQVLHTHNRGGQRSEWL